MPAQTIAPATAGEPPTSPWTWAHPLAGVATHHCQQHSTPVALLIGGVACTACWDRAICDDLEFALTHGLPLGLDAESAYVDEIAVERVMRGEDLELTELERAEVRRRLAEIRTRRNRGYRFVCSRAAAARREVQR